MNKIACVVTIAGTDPSGGAGIQADIKAISATGAYAASIITSLVAQNTQRVHCIEPISKAFIQKQMEVVFDDLEVDAIKIGMLQDAGVIEVIASQLQQITVPHIVLDPVMVAKDGSALLDLTALTVLKERLLSRVSLITPNIPEAEYLSGMTICNRKDMESVATQLGKSYQVNVLLKGGHLDTEVSHDVLYVSSEDRCHWFKALRFRTKNTHGTGCSLSSAIASYLAQGMPLLKSVALAKEYITKAIQSGAHLSIGKGCGPVDHFYFLDNRKESKT